MGSLALSLGHGNRSRHATGGTGASHGQQLLGLHQQLCAAAARGTFGNPSALPTVSFSRAEQGGFDPTHPTTRARRCCTACYESTHREPSSQTAQSPSSSHLPSRCCCPGVTSRMVVWAWDRMCLQLAGPAALALTVIKTLLSLQRGSAKVTCPRAPRRKGWWSSFTQARAASQQGVERAGCKSGMTNCCSTWSP